MRLSVLELGTESLKLNLNSLELWALSTILEKCCTAKPEVY